MAKGKKKRKQDFFDLAGQSIVSMMNLLSHLVRTIGWPGTIFIMLYHVFMKYGSTEQKQEFIDKYILFKDTEQFAWVIFFGLLSIIVCASQKYIYDRKLREKNKEIDRLSKWKTDHQEGSISKDLHHT